MKRQIIAASAIAALMFSSIAPAIADPVQTQAKKATVKKVKITKKTFPDTVFRELVKANYDKNKDKTLSVSEIKKAKKFGTGSCKNSVKIKASKYAKYEKKYVKDIKDFKGIEKLVYLQKFVANDMSVKTVNFKKNTRLKYLEMRNGKLKKLDLNKNTKLQYLYLPYNPLTTLKVNKCKKLLEVDLTGHMVKNLKINRNKKTEVIGEEYYAPFAETKIKTDFTNINGAGSRDASGKYCVYEWNSDNTACTKKVFEGTQVTTATIMLDAAVTNRAKSMQAITAQWQDSHGNFYFVGDQDGNMVAAPRNYLFKVNPQGVLEKEVLLNDWLKVPQADGVYRYNLYLIGKKDNVVAFRMENRGNAAANQSGAPSPAYLYGVVLFDMDKMEVTTQADCTFRPEAVEGDVIAGLEGDNDVMTCRLSGGEKIAVGQTASNEKAADQPGLDAAESSPSPSPAGQSPEPASTQEDNAKKIHEITYHKAESMTGNRIAIPEREGFTQQSLAVRDNYVYLINSRGFFRAKLTANSFEQLYGVGKIAGLQDPNMEYYMMMNSEKEIHLLFSQKEDGKVVYSLSQCKVG